MNKVVRVRPLRIGDVLHGFCGGAFGRDSYADKRVEAIGTDWVVVRNTEDGVEFFWGNPEELTGHRAEG